MTDEKLQELYQKAIKICSDNGYEPKNINGYCYQTRKDVYGKVVWASKPYVYVSKVLVERGTEKQILGVLLHECLHVVFGHDEDHGKEWQKAANNIGRICGINIQARWDEYDSNGEFINPAIYAPYVITCTKCGFKDYYYSRCKIVKNYNNGKYRCPDCGNNHFEMSFREEYL